MSFDILIGPRRKFLFSKHNKLEFHAISLLASIINTFGVQWKLSWSLPRGFRVSSERDKSRESVHPHFFSTDFSELNLYKMLNPRRGWTCFQHAYHSESSKSLIFCTNVHKMRMNTYIFAHQINAYTWVATKTQCDTQFYPKSPPKWKYTNSYEKGYSSGKFSSL